MFPSVACVRFNFNPRSRVGSDAFRLNALSLKAISIHAPVWGATPTALVLRISFVISIHAPVWGATRSFL